MFLGEDRAKLMVFADRLANVDPDGKALHNVPGWNSKVTAGQYVATLAGPALIKQPDIQAGRRRVFGGLVIGCVCPTPIHPLLLLLLLILLCPLAMSPAIP